MEQRQQAGNLEAGAHGPLQNGQTVHWDSSGADYPGFSAADHPRSVWRTLNPQTHNTHYCLHLQPLTLACWSAQGQSAAAAARSTRQLRCAPPQLAAAVGRLSASRRSALSGRRAARVPACTQRGDGRAGRIVDDGAAGSAPVAEDTAASAAHLGACVGARGGQGGPCPRGCAVYRIVCRRAVSISREKIETSKISMKYLLEVCERAKFSRAGAGGSRRPRGARSHGEKSQDLSLHGMQEQNLACPMKSRLEARERPKFYRGLAPKRRSRRGFSGRDARKNG